MAPVSLKGNEFTVEEVALVLGKRRNTVSRWINGAVKGPSLRASKRSGYFRVISAAALRQMLRVAGHRFPVRIAKALEGLTDDSDARRVLFTAAGQPELAKATA